MLPALIWIVATTFFMWWAHFWPALAYRYASYVVGPDGLEIRRGVLFRSVTNVPRSRVQHTDVSQGPIERAHRLGSLIVYTAGTDHAPRSQRQKGTSKDPAPHRLTHPARQGAGWRGG